MSKQSERNDITWINLADLKPYELNPRTNHSAVSVVAGSIERNGFLQPIIIDQDNTICAGHTRYEAAKSLNMIKVPCIKKEMTDQEFIDLNLVDNQSHRLSKWDKKKLKAMMDLVTDLESVKSMGFSDAEVDKVFGHSSTETHSTEADFGDAGTIDDTIDPDAIEKKMTFVFNAKEHRHVSSKLKALKKEHGLSTIAHALIKALEPYKGLSGPRLRKGGQ